MEFIFNTLSTFPASPAHLPQPNKPKKIHNYNGDKAKTMMVLILHYLIDLMIRIGNDENGKDNRVNEGKYDIYQKCDIAVLYHDLLVPLTPCGNPSSTVYKALKY